MKHILCLCLTALLCCLLYTGCKQQPASFVQSAQLSQNEQALLQLLEIEQPQLFDFSVEGAKSLSLELFTLENGSWKPAGSFSENIDQPPAPVASSAGPTRTPTKSAHWRWRTLAPSSASSHRWIRCLLPPATDKAPSPGDEELRALRARCKQLCYAFNTTEHQQREERINLLRQLLGSTNGRFLIEPSFWCDYGYNIHLGKNFYANHNCVILDCAKVTFGDHVMVGPNCGFYTACHPIDPQQRREGVEFARPITVGNDVWFGGSCTVLPGVTIGDGCVIGAGSVVTRDIPANTVAAGNPCRVLRSISEADRMDLMR